MVKRYRKDHTIQSCGSGGSFYRLIKVCTDYKSAPSGDASIIQFGKEAMDEGIKSNRTVIQPGSNTIIKGESSNGIKFLGYQDPTTGEILNFHPVISY